MLSSLAARLRAITGSDDNLGAGSVETSMLTQRRKSSGNGKDSSLEEEVLRRYKAGAREQEAALCCPVTYDPQYLKILPQEIIEKDYGCGDPSVYVEEGERVLDLGSGAGKICYILSQKVGASGSVVGVDFNEDMLALARKYLPHMEEKIGYGNVCFVKGKIQDLSLDLDRVQGWLDANPIETVEQMSAFEHECSSLRSRNPLVPSDSVDVVVSNCVLNLVAASDKGNLFKGIHRVLARGGRAVISDIVCDEDPPESIRSDPKLWSGCIAGAFREDRFLEMFEEAGFYGVEILDRQEEPWRVIEGIEFRSLTVRAYKGKQGPCMERNQAVIYKGPWNYVRDDDGHTLYRGKRTAVCDKTHTILTNPRGPYGADVISVQPYDEVPADEARPWNSDRPELRHPRESKGMDYDVTTEGDSEACCGPSCC